MSEAIKTKAQDAQTFFTDLQVSIGMAEVCISKDIIEEPNLSAMADALNDIDAVFQANFGKTEGSILANLEAKKQILDDGIA